MGREVGKCGPFMSSHVPARTWGSVTTLGEMRRGTSGDCHSLLGGPLGATLALGQEVRLPSWSQGGLLPAQTPRALRAPRAWTWGEVNETTQVVRGLLSVTKQPSADHDIPLSLKSFPCLPPSPHLPQLTVSWSPGGQAKHPNTQHFRGNLSSRIQGTLILRRTNEAALRSGAPRACFQPRGLTNIPYSCAHGYHLLWKGQREKTAQRQ